jgi:hypothetical protein
VITDPLVLDGRLNGIRNVTSGWGLPPLPDDTVLDLAANDALVDPVGFLHALAADIRKRITFGLSDDTGTLVVPEARSALETFPQVQDVLGIRRLERIRPDAVVRFKQRAASMGLWQPPTDALGNPIFDDRWDPSLNRIRAEMARQDYLRRLYGDRWGATPTDKVLRTLGDFFDPANLLQVAMDMDFIPDIGNITREFRTWGDKWRHWWKNKTSPRAFLDAMTGPIDDIAVPTINLLLLATGVSEAYMGVRFALAGANIARSGLFASKAASMASRAGWLSRFTGAERAARLLAADRTPGVLASTFMRSSNPLLSRTGSAMAAWRRTAAVAAVKAGMRPILRLGQVGVAEAYVAPWADYFRSGRTNSEALDEIRARRKWQSHGLGGLLDLADWVVMPATLWPDGSFRRLVMPAVNSFRRLREQAWTWHNAQAHVAALAEAAETSETFRLAAREGRLKDALVDAWGSEEMASLAMAHFTTVAGAQVRALDIAGGRTGPAFENAFNAILAQLRQIPEGDIGQFLAVLERDETFLRELPLPTGRMSSLSSDVRPEAVKRAWHEALGKIVAQGGPKDAVDRHVLDTMNLWITKHNELGQQLMDEILDRAKPEIVADFVRRYMEGQNPANWLVAQEVLHTLDPRIVGRAMMPEALSTPRSAAFQVAPPGSTEVSDDVIKGIVDQLVRNYDPETTPMLFRSLLDPLSRNVDDLSARAHLSIAPVTHVSRQDAEMLVASVRWRQKELEVLRSALGRSDAWLANLRRQRDAYEWLTSNLGPTGEAVYRRMFGRTQGSLKGGKQVRRYLQRVVDAMQAELDHMHHLPEWEAWFGLQPHLYSSIDDLLDAAEQAARTKAVEVIPGENAPVELREAAERIKSLGYRLVWSMEHAAPWDVVRHVPSLDGLYAEGRRRWSLGTWLMGTSPLTGDAYFALTERNLRHGLAAILEEHPAFNPHITVDPEAGAELWIVSLRRYVERIQRNLVNNYRIASPQGRMQRLATSVSMALSRNRLYELNNAQIREALGIDDPVVVQKIRRALRKARDVGWKYQGLDRIDAFLRTHDPLTAGLKAMTVAFGRHPRAAVVGGALFGALGGAFSDDPLHDVPMGALQGAALGGGLALVGAGLERFVTPALEHFFVTHPRWHWWTNLPDDLLWLRDRLRFDLSPLFGLSQVLEGLTVASIRDMPDNTLMSWRLGLKHLGRQYGPEEVERAKALWGMAQRGLYDQISQLVRGKLNWTDELLEAREQPMWHAIDVIDRFLDERNMIGWSPQQFMATAFYRMLYEHGEQFMDDPVAMRKWVEEAHHVAERLAGYGRRGRSALERSVNFVFFPFSYQRKLVEEGARFLAHDLGRIVLINDGLKLYDMLDENHDLGRMWKDHLPLLQQFQRLNAFAYGLSPGVFGGINRPILNILSAKMPYANVFMPQLVSVNVKGAQSWTTLLKKLAPVVNDVQYLYEDAVDNLGVVTSDSHLAAQAQIRRAQLEWDQFKEEIDQWAKSHGWGGWLSVFQSPALANVKQYVHDRKTQLLEKYPAWRRQREEMVATLTRKEDDKLIMLRREGPLYDQLRAFALFEEQMRTVLRRAGISVEKDPEDVPPEIYQAVRQRAVQIVANFPDFLPIYRRIYQGVWGPLGVEF